MEALYLFSSVAAIQWVPIINYNYLVVFLIALFGQVSHDGRLAPKGLCNLSQGIFRLSCGERIAERFFLSAPPVYCELGGLGAYVKRLCGKCSQ